MVNIREGQAPVTLINVFEVEPDRQRELVTLLSTATTEVMRLVPGFVSASIHASLDGRRVVNYAQWETPEHFQRMPEFPGAKAHMEQAAKLALNFTPLLCAVAAVHEK